MSTPETSHELTDAQTPETVQRFESLTEAEIACGLLVSAGLHASLQEHQLMAGVSVSLPIEGLVELQVPASEFEDATKLLADVQQSGGTLASDVAEAAAADRAIS